MRKMSLLILWLCIGATNQHQTDDSVSLSAMGAC